MVGKVKQIRDAGLAVHTYEIDYEADLKAIQGSGIPMTLDTNRPERARSLIHPGAPAAGAAAITAATPAPTTVTPAHTAVAVGGATAAPTACEGHFCGGMPYPQPFDQLPPPPSGDKPCGEGMYTLEDSREVLIRFLSVMEKHKVPIDP